MNAVPAARVVWPTSTSPAYEFVLSLADITSAGLVATASFVMCPPPSVTVTPPEVTRIPPPLTLTPPPVVCMPNGTASRPFARTANTSDEFVDKAVSKSKVPAPTVAVDAFTTDVLEPKLPDEAVT